MGKVTVAATLISTVVLLVTFGKAMLVLRGGADFLSHLYWAVATLVLVLSGNVIAMVHAARADRLIAELTPAMVEAIQTRGKTVRLNRADHRRTHLVEMERAVQAARQAGK